MFSCRYLWLVVLLVFFSGQVLALSDPTQPSSYKAVSKKKRLRVESILFSETRKVAVINGAVVAEGDSIGSAKIIQIDKGSVRISDGGKTTDLMLERMSVRQEK